MAEKQLLEMFGWVVEPRPKNNSYIVRLEDGRMIAAQPGGDVLRRRIRLLSGEKVRVEISAYDPTRGRITYRETRLD